MSARTAATALWLAAALAATGAHAQEKTPETKAHVTALAAPANDGRLTGSAGERRAGDYIVSQLRRIGALPLPGHGDYRLAFQFTAGARDSGSSLTVTPAAPTRDPGVGATSFASESDVRALSFSDDGSVSGALVFAGYGIVVPENQGFSYDSYASLDVKDKIVVVLRYFPEDADQKTKGILAHYAGLRYKALAARERGARGVLVVAGPRSPNAGETIPMSFDTALSGSGIVAASVSARVAAALFAGAQRGLADAQRMLDSGDPHVAGYELPGVTVSVRASIVRERQAGNNIVAYLPATTRAAADKPWVALGAHYDHLGHGHGGTSLAGKEQAGAVHPGADDNASGTAAVLAAGEALAGQPRGRNVLLCLWSGEEFGLLGSAAFAAAPPVPLDGLDAYLNFDMVGRMRENKLILQATGTSAAWPRILEQANVAAGFDLTLHEDPYQPTDVATFNQAGVPSLNFFTGPHADYHRPGDTADKINYADLDRVAAFAATIVQRVAARDEALAFTRVEPRGGGRSGRAGLRVFTGTIPDYATEVQGLLLGGVVGGGPAEQAGLQKGDVIVELAGQAIANVYDYTYALDALKIGQPAKLVYLRNGRRIETTLTPAARK